MRCETLDCVDVNSGTRRVILHFKGINQHQGFSYVSHDDIYFSRGISETVTENDLDDLPCGNFLVVPKLADSATQVLVNFLDVDGSLTVSPLKDFTTDGNPSWPSFQTQVVPQRPSQVCQPSD